MNKERPNNNELMKTTSVNYNFTVLRPGGNDTCLVQSRGEMPLPDQRKRINDFMQGVYPNVEQVGFVKLDPKQPELMMAGGEFCGNATRGTAWQSLNGKPGEVTIKVSGVEQRLKAGVSTNGEAFAQMPIYPDISKIVRDSDTSYIVEMEGIVHYIDFSDNATKGLSPDEIKNKAAERIKEKGLDQYPAAGIIYATRDEQGIRIEPVVYVRDLKTLYYETACGSGTTALGLVLALETGDSIKNVPIVQPSGMEIKVSVDFDGKSFQYAQIQGEIEELNKGDLEVRENAGIVTEQIDTAEKLQEALSEGNLKSLYQDIFSKPPYLEKFADGEVEDIFAEYMSDGLLFLAKNDSGVIGFGAALPMSSVTELSQILANAGKDISSGWYMADLGVDDDFRRNGIARKLVEARLNALPQGINVFMRTSVNNIASQSLYRSIGFKQVPDASQEVMQQRTDGSIQRDTRLFLERKI